MAAWPRRLFDIDSDKIRYVADINETIRSSNLIALVRKPDIKPPVGRLAFAEEGNQVASSAELEELDDAEAAVQGPALSAEQMELVRTLEEATGTAESESLVASLADPLGDAVNRLALPDTADQPDTSGASRLLSRLASRSKPAAPPKPIALPITPKKKGRAPLSLASLTSPEAASGAGKNTSSSTKRSSRGQAPKRNGSSGTDTRTLKLYNIHTGDKVEATYMRNGRYVESELKRLNWLMRDRRNGAIRRIDPALFDALHAATASVGARGRTINVLSGYRSKESNDKLRRQSSGVAKNSYHTLGRAVDFRVPGLSIASMHKHALKINAGGVGYYPSSNFIHIDTGPVRAWPSRYNYIAKRYQRPT